MQIRRADERHLSVARRAVDGDAEFHQAVAGRVDVVDLIGEMAEITILAVFFLVPIIGELDQRCAASLGRFEEALIFGGAQKHQREFRLVVVDAADLLQPQRILIEFQRGIEIADAQHGVEITHVSCSLEKLKKWLSVSALSIAAKCRRGQGVCVRVKASLLPLALWPDSMPFGGRILKYVRSNSLLN